MANDLVDFVMAVVRDPAVAAAYADDPVGTLAGADLGDVTPADVDTLIPMLTDSVAPAPFTAATSPPEVGTGEVGAGGDVWASGAATAAFDSFGPVDAAGTGADASIGSGIDGWPVMSDVTVCFGGGAFGAHAVPAGGGAAAVGDDAAPGLGEASTFGVGLGDVPLGDVLLGDDQARSGVDAAFLDGAHGPAGPPSDPGSFDLF